ncbi:MAG: M36 family metallopeptidase, partial [Acidobacteria bacterium]|nr:M36 family metallopeptidase [Acidobacteriota bacterium]
RITAVGGAKGPTRRQEFRTALLQGATAEYAWLPMDGQTLRLCWEVLFTSKARGELYRVLVDAETGEELLRHCLTEYISNATYRVFPSDSPSPFSPGHPAPNSTQPAVVARTLITTPALNTTASPNGWIDDGINETRGNNVDAHTDTNADNLPDLPRVQGSPSRVFDPPLDLTQAPASYRDAAVVNLFYWNNRIHDRFYELGFTESAGNFQNVNFGRGGLGNDAVQADAQDGSGTNNANFSTPPDGSPGRMQMYIFSGPTPDRDGDFDAEIIIHEYTHGLSNRLVGGGAGLSALQSRGMGEGWSDFYALCLLSEAGDDINGNYVSGGYASYLITPTYTTNYYFGIRRYPYTTDLTKNPLTFRDIDPSQA